MFKTYSTLTSAKTAIKNAGLKGMTVRYDPVATLRSTNIMPVVLCELEEDVIEVETRGFKAEMAL